MSSDRRTDRFRVDRVQIKGDFRPLVRVMNRWTGPPRSSRAITLILLIDREEVRNESRPFEDRRL